MRKIIGEYWEEGYIIKDDDTGKELYRTTVIDCKGYKADIESVRIWCEQTGNDMAAALGTKFLGVTRKG